MVDAAPYRIASLLRHQKTNFAVHRRTAQQMRQTWHFLILLLCIPLLSGCPLGIPPPVIVPPVKTSGAMLLSHGNYLYFLGGMLEDGTVSSRTYVASIDQAAEGDLQWTETTPMPSGRAHGAAVAVGNMLFVIGGSDGTGPLSSILYTSISSTDGTLGFGKISRFWETNPNELPYELSHMSHVLHDGRVFLVGGLREKGVSDAIIHARIWQKGMIGMWYESKQKLPSARFRTAAAILSNDADPTRPHLVVAGGMDSAGKVLDETILFPLGRYGKLEPAARIAAIPKALDSPILVPGMSDLLIGGGFDCEAKACSKAYRYDSFSDCWMEIPDDIPAQGPSFGRGKGDIWYLSQEQEEPEGVASRKPEGYHPSVPVIGPGSGIVQANTTVIFKAEAGTAIMFSKEEGAWKDIASLGAITEDQVVAFKASSIEDNVDSPVTVRDYRLQGLDFLVHIAGNISLMNPDDDFKTIHMTDEINNKDATGRNSVRVMFQLFRPAEIVIRWKDASSSEPGPYTAPVELSLFEEDLLTAAIDNAGYPILGLSGDAGQPVEATLQKGTYYFTFKDAQGEAGRSFGLSMYERE